MDGRRRLRRAGAGPKETEITDAVMDSQPPLWECASCAVALGADSGAGRYDGAIYCPDCRKKREEEDYDAAVRARHSRARAGKVRNVLLAAAFGVLCLGVFASLNGINRFLLTRRYDKQRPAAPDFAATDSNGRLVTMAGLRGKVVVLDFWASWCQPCIRLIPDLKNFHERYDGKDVVVLGVNMDENTAKLRAALDKYDIRWTQIWDRNPAGPEISDLYDVSEIPMTIIIDQEGRVFKRWGTWDRKMQVYVEYLLRRGSLSTGGP